MFNIDQVKNAFFTRLMANEGDEDVCRVDREPCGLGKAWMSKTKLSYGNVPGTYREQNQTHPSNSHRIVEARFLLCPLDPQVVTAYTEKGSEDAYPPTVSTQGISDFGSNLPYNAPSAARPPSSAESI